VAEAEDRNTQHRHRIVCTPHAGGSGADTRTLSCARLYRGGLRALACIVVSPKSPVIMEYMENTLSTDVDIWSKDRFVIFFAFVDYVYCCCKIWVGLKLNRQQSNEISNLRQGQI